MADYNQQSGAGGYKGEERKPVSTYNAHQDEFGFKEGDDYPADQQRGSETFQDAPDRMTGYGDTDSGVGGPKSFYGTSSEGTGAYDSPTSEQTQFGLEGKTGSYGTEGSDPQLGEIDTSSYAAVDPTAPEDTSRTHETKKDGMVNKIKEKLPGHHNTAGGDPNAPPKKGMVEKIKEKLPGHHGSSTTGM